MALIWSPEHKGLRYNEIGRNKDRRIAEEWTKVYSVSIPVACPNAKDRSPPQFA